MNDPCGGLTPRRCGFDRLQSQNVTVKRQERTSQIVKRQTKHQHELDGENKAPRAHIGRRVMMQILRMLCPKGDALWASRACRCLRCSVDANARAILVFMMLSMVLMPFQVPRPRPHPATFTTSENTRPLRRRTRRRQANTRLSTFPQIASLGPPRMSTWSQSPGSVGSAIRTTLGPSGPFVSKLGQPAS